MSTLLWSAPVTKIACWCGPAASRRWLPLLFGITLFSSGVPADVPVNGRPQGLAFDRADLHAFAAETYRLRLQALAEEGKLDRDADLTARVRGVAARIVAQAILLKPEAAEWQWEVHVATTSRIEASSMAGGKILLGLPSAEAAKLSDADIAALLGHEVGHAIAEHVREQLSEVRRLDPAYAQFSLEDTVAVLTWDLSVALTLQPLSRLQELEADDLGIHLTAKSGFRPHGLAALYRKLDSNQGGSGSLDSHVAADQRERAVSAFVAYAKAVYLESASEGQDRIGQNGLSNASLANPD